MKHVLAKTVEGMDDQPALLVPDEQGNVELVSPEMYEWEQQLARAKELARAAAEFRARDDAGNLF